MRGAKTKNIPYSIWELVEHIRIAQWDIVEFSRNPNHISPDWPDEYWPAKNSPESDNVWNASIEAIHIDLQDMIEMVLDPQNNLLKPFLHGNGQTLLREAMLLADHNAYHLGQIILIRKILGDWK